MSMMELDAYLERIGYDHAVAPTLETLYRIQLLHTQAIAFENLDSFLGLPVSLDQASLMRKLVHDRRGGYCLEQNLLLQRMLEVIGFKVVALAARVDWQKAPDAITPSTHMLLKVSIDGDCYIVDAGFGGQVITAPLRLAPDVVQSTPHESFTLQVNASKFSLSSLVGGMWQALYSFDLSERVRPDFEILNYYLSTSASSHFVSDLMVARPRPGRRLALHAASRVGQAAESGSCRRKIATLAEHRVDAATMRRDIVTVEDLVHTLRTEFDLKLSDAQPLHDRFAA